MTRVVHPAQRVPNPDTLAVLHRGGGNWAASRAGARTTHPWDTWRERGRAIRTDAVAHLPELLAQFEAAVTAAGGTVHHAATAADARRIVVGLCAERGLRRAIKAKSMLSEEIGLNPALTAAGVEVVETDLGEWIVQLLGQRPSHILAPAIHVSADEVAALFSQRSGTAYTAQDASGMVGYARDELRAAFLAGDVGISGVNLAVASTGTLALLESEGNIRLATGLPRVHVALMGIEKVVRDWDAAGHLLQLLPLAAHGKPAATYTSLITGVGDDDGPDELHVVLVDDGRSALRGTDLESALHCIRCGACLHACPVYRQVGGHAYGAAYAGPIGAVLTPALEDSAPPSDELPWLSSLCGACSEACPVGIPLDEHLVTLRARERHGGTERAFWEAWGRLWARPSTYRATAATAGRALRPLWRAAGGTDWAARAPGPWTDGRDTRVPAVEPFHVRWRRRRGAAAPTPAATAPPAAELEASDGGPDPVQTPEGRGGGASALGPGAEPAAGPVGDDSDPVDRFVARVEALDGSVLVVDGLAAARDAARALVAGGTVCRFDDPELDQIAGNLAPASEADVSLILADVAVADTGQIGFAHRPGRPRAAGLLPDRQIALLDRRHLRRSLPDALSLWFDDARVGKTNVVLAAGPSRTADIEQQMMLGVHAPRSLDIVLF